MSFDPGTRFGPYEIVAPLGAGGMGEVYRARDTRLDRTVAVKVLTGGLAADAESRQRFEQEARAIAALNDPRICTIHDVGRHGDLDYLVLEYLEGETLADRLRRPPALPIDEALAIAIQIGDALDRAHGAGIVHRDLKPGNVMLLRGGAAAGGPAIKLLDFGLAARTAPARAPGIEATMAATMAASVAATRPPGATASSGFSGTIPYMAPEQLDGLEGDHRADIFAFGCVLYEMLAGRKPFEGASAMTVIAAIMSTEPPPIPALARQPHLDHLLRRCLEKDRDRRWQHIGDVTGELRWAVEHPVAPAAVTAAAAPSWVRTALIAAGALAVAAVSIAAVFRPWRTPAAPALPVLRYEIATPPTDEPGMALSPDETRLAFVANQDRVPMLWVRSLDATENRVLAGTQGARYPFWSPDGRHLGFFADNKLKRVEVGGGAPIVITDAANGRGATWNADGVILFTPGVSAPVMRVSAAGGPAQPVTQVNTGTGPDHRFAQFLPDGTRFLFASTLGTAETNGLYIASLDGGTPVRVREGSGGRFVPPDLLVVRREDLLQAYRFNPTTATIEDGEPAVLMHGFADAYAFTASETVLAFRPGSNQRRQLIWVNRQGTQVGTVGPPDSDMIASPELSPDERNVVVFRQTPDNDIWVIELARSLARRVTTGRPADAHPLWDPDGEHVVYVSRRFEKPGPARQSINGGDGAPLFPGLVDGRIGMVVAWSPDRSHVLARRDNGDATVDLIALPLAAGGKEIAVAAAPQIDETEGQFSPDSKWVAFVAHESNQPNVFVQSFPEGRGRTQVSTAGGTQVRWARDGREIYYVAPDGKLMAVAVNVSGTAPEVKAPVALFQTHLATGTNVLGIKPQYAVARDGRFLLNTALETASPPIAVTVNWRKALIK